MYLMSPGAQVVQLPAVRMLGLKGNAKVTDRLLGTELSLHAPSPWVGVGHQVHSCLGSCLLLQQLDLWLRTQVKCRLRRSHPASALPPSGRAEPPELLPSFVGSP